ncbi:MAG: 50S ribosomal protein L32 [Anaerolineaceae bacterium]|nr:MAG: 50S ribosomal protein L32 [Anaerolineaceae bacterium]
MGPLPKRKISKTRRNKRRTHDKISLPNLIYDANTDEYRLAHHVGKTSGMYKGRQVIEPEDED